MVSPYFPIEEYESRWGRVHAEMKRRGFDAAVVWGRSAGGFAYAQSRVERRTTP